MSATPKSTAPSAPTTPDTTERPRRAAAIPQPTTPVPSKLRQSEAPDDEGNHDFAGKTFQQAQEHLIREIIEYTE